MYLTIKCIYKFEIFFFRNLNIFKTLTLILNKLQGFFCVGGRSKFEYNFYFTRSIQTKLKTNKMKLNNKKMP